MCLGDKLLIPVSVHRKYSDNLLKLNVKLLRHK